MNWQQQNKLEAYLKADLSSLRLSVEVV